jgi:hypothetical protein
MSLQHQHQLGRRRHHRRAGRRPRSGCTDRASRWKNGSAAYSFSHLVSDRAESEGGGKSEGGEEQGGANEWTTGLTAAECTAGPSYHPSARIEPSTDTALCTSRPGERSVRPPLHPLGRVAAQGERKRERERQRGERIYVRVEEGSTA